MAEQNRKKGRIGTLTGVLLLVFSAVFVFSAYKLIDAQMTYRQGEDTYDAIVQAVVSKPAVVPTPVTKPQEPLSQPTEQTAPTEAPVQEEEVPYVPLLDVDFDALYEMNGDTIAWLSMESGEINYPVVQGTDNDYYANHLFDGTANRNGAIFMDYRNKDDFSDRNTFIYGHNMGNGTMFAVLLKYSTPGYYAQHPELILVTPEASFYLQPFSGYVTSPKSTTYQMEFAHSKAFSNYLEQIREKSDFQSDIEVTAKDRIVTLSTCSYAFNNARYVLHCKLLPAREKWIEKQDLLE